MAKARFYSIYALLIEIDRQFSLGKVAIRLKQLLHEAVRVNLALIRELNIQRNPVHMLYQIGTKVSVALAVQHLEGGTSYKLRKEFPA